MHYFTSITSNYLPKARILAKSIKRHNKDAVFHVVLSDKIPEDINIKKEPYDSLILINDLGIPNLDSWIFKHTVVELCTAVKGQAFVKIFELYGADKVVYLDPDILVLSNLKELSDMLDKNSVILTPHLLVPETSDDAINDNEICSLKHGVYNLGFIAVRKCESSDKVIKWWRDRLLNYCYDDIPNGLFTDQRWMDLAPAFFEDIYILRDKTYNVATWNLSHRFCRLGQNGELVIDGVPIKFFHFSGFDSGAQEIMLTKYAKDNNVLFELRKWYIKELKNEGQNVFGDIPCIYNYYSNGEIISKSHRMLYRNRIDLINAFPHPAVVTDKQLCFYNWFKSKNFKLLKIICLLKSLYKKIAMELGFFK